MKGEGEGEGNYLRWYVKDDKEMRLISIQNRTEQKGKKSEEEGEGGGRLWAPERGRWSISIVSQSIPRISECGW